MISPCIYLYVAREKEMESERREGVEQERQRVDTTFVSDSWQLICFEMDTNWPAPSAAQRSTN